MLLGVAESKRQDVLTLWLKLLLEATQVDCCKQQIRERTYFLNPNFGAVLLSLLIDGFL